MTPRDRWLLGITGAVLVAACTVLASAGPLDERVPLLLSTVAVAFPGYALAAWIVLRRGPSGRGLLAGVVAVAALSRLVLVPAAPSLSTDIHRYLWEGRAIVHGFNPFATAPADPALEALRDANYGGVSHKDMETIYPPLAQGVFALGALLDSTISFLKLLFVLFDVGTVLVLMALLRLRELDPARSLIYAWNPLVIIETGHSGHVDAVGIFFLVLGLFLLLRPRGNGGRAAAFVSFVASFLSKYAAAVLVPWFAARRRYLPWLAFAAVAAATGFLPFAGAGDRMFASLRTYSMEWQFNGLAFRMLTALWDEPLLARRLLVLAAGVAVVVQALRQGDVVRYAFFAVACVLLAVPTLYPWYVLWVVPFLCVFPNRAWMLFTALVFVSYLIWPISEQTGQWRLPAWALALEYAPFLALLVFDAWRHRRRQAGEVTG